MPLRRGSSFPRTSGRAPRRKTSWEESPAGLLTSVGDSAVTVFPTALAIIQDGITLVRTRGDLILQLTGAAAGNNGEVWAFGMCVVNVVAATLGITALPSPLAEKGWDQWFVYETGTLLSRDATPTDDNSQSPVQRVRIDSKAMRKMGIDDVIVAVLANAEIGGSSVMAASFQGRMLFKLP